MSSKPEEVSANTLDFSLRVQSLGKKGSEQFGLHGLLQKSTDGTCQLKQIRA